MFIHNQISILLIVVWLVMTYSFMTTKRRRYTIWAALVASIVLFYMHFRAQAQLRIHHAPVRTLEDLSADLQPGDLIFGASRYALTDLPVFDKIRYFLNQTFCHSVIVMEHQGAKYAYHSLPKHFYQKYRVEKEPGHADKYMVGVMQNDWTVILEPLDMFLKYDGIVEGEIFHVARANQRITYQPALNTKVCAEKDFFHVHCNVVTGLYLAFAGIIPPNRAPQSHSTYFMPEGILHDLKSQRRYDVKLW
jgi:hypothetical protein